MDTRLFRRLAGPHPSDPPSASASEGSDGVVDRPVDRSGVRRRRGWGRRRLALAVVLVSALSACNAWEQPGYGAGRTRFNPDETAITPDNVDRVGEAWSSSVDGSFSEPILSGDRLYTTVSSAGRGSVRAYHAGTGAIAWETPLPAPANPRAPGPVVLAGGALWASYSGTRGSSCALLTRLDPATGDVLGTETTGGAVVDAVTVDGTTMAFTTQVDCAPTGSQPQLVVRDTGSSTARWTYRFPTDAGSPSVPSMGNGRIVVAADDHIYAFDSAGCGAATCEPVWVTPLDHDGVDVFNTESRPVVGPDGTVYVGASTQDTETFVVALDGATGTPLWRTDRHAAPGSGWQFLSLAHGQLYVSDQRVSSPTGGAVEVFTAAGCGQPVCTPVWTASVEGPPVAGLSVGGDVLYLGEFDWEDSQFLAFDARGCGTTACSRLTSIGFGDEQPLRVAVANGRIAVVAAGASGETLRVLTPSS